MFLLFIAGRGKKYAKNGTWFIGFRKIVYVATLYVSKQTLHETRSLVCLQSIFFSEQFWPHFFGLQRNLPFDIRSRLKRLSNQVTAWFFHKLGSTRNYLGASLGISTKFWFDLADVPVWAPAFRGDLTVIFFITEAYKYNNFC